MKIFLAHNYYRNRGGEDIAFEQEAQLLSDYFHEVFTYTKDNKTDISKISDKIALIFNTQFSKASFRRVSTELEESNPDVVHVHNFFPLITPAIFYACKEKNIPVVLTLHNYRLFHPNGLFLNNGKIDERGLHDNAYQCITDKVYRDSYLQTAVVAHMIEYHKKRDTWNSKVDRFIALSEFAKHKFIEGGISEDKIRVKPNYVDDPFRNKSLELSKNERPYFIFVGRISLEKDIETILHCWEMLDKEFHLKIIGEGPLREKLQSQTCSYNNIEWLGNIPREKVFEYLHNAKALLFSSRCYENFPLTILEAFSVATPVISSNIGSHSEIVKHDFNGLHFQVGDAEDLASKIIELKSDNHLADRLSSNARNEYENKYTPEENIKKLYEIYGEISNS